MFIFRVLSLPLPWLVFHLVRWNCSAVQLADLVVGAFKQSALTGSCTGFHIYFARNGDPVWNPGSGSERSEVSDLVNLSLKLTADFQKGSQRLTFTLRAESKLARNFLFSCVAVLVEWWQCRDSQPRLQENFSVFCEWTAKQGAFPAPYDVLLPVLRLTLREHHCFCSPLFYWWNIRHNK